MPFPVITLAALLAATATGAEDAPPRAGHHRVEAVTGAESWETLHAGVRLTLTQILPDQVRGFYYARGFDAESVERLATQGCVFQTILRNESASGAVHNNLADWRALRDGGERPLKLKDEWRQEWERRGVPPSARLAFHWALFPTVQQFAVGDWNMGMTTYVLPLGSRFDLRIVWTVDGEPRQTVLTSMRCATEPAPAKPKGG
jgi:hypothetical protein